MNEGRSGKDPFHFYSRMLLPELTGLRASDLGEMLSIIKNAEPSVIYHHTHRFIQQHQYLTPEPPNDFAFWISGVLGEYKLGEKLESISTIDFPSIGALKDKIVSVIEQYVKSCPEALNRKAHPGEEFHFVKSVSFIFPTDYWAADLDEFAEALGKVAMSSIYFHMFEARLRLEKGNNDFSFWIGSSMGDTELAGRISRLDPYTYTLEQLREKIISMIKERKVN
ncbi:MAG TPA: DUF5752 family protein [Candidatus Omnitrophota bacterium]|nr:DUF5752 family protein [Candidatus Omnitrophota bacterium]